MATELWIPKEKYQGYETNLRDLRDETGSGFKHCKNLLLGPKVEFTAIMSILWIIHILNGNSEHVAHTWMNKRSFWRKNPVYDYSPSNQMP